MNDDSRCLICVDMGTTNTRVWLVRAAAGEIVARTNAQIGVRDSAREKSNTRVRRVLHEAISEVLAQARAREPSLTPWCVAAAGMITSPLGLVEVPHVAAPADCGELAAHVQLRRFPDITELPFLLVPGVRSGDAGVAHDAEAIGLTDVMRGEETLCFGLQALQLLQPGATLLNLGSHWKAIQTDAQERITSSVTSLSGELIHAAQTNTILASAVPPERPAALNQNWIEHGMREQRQSGLARALFCVRLLEQSTESTPGERLAFLIGAFIAADLDALIKRQMLKADVPVVIAGSEALATAWKRALKQANFPAISVTNDQVERALLAGLEQVISQTDAYSHNV